VINNTGKVTLNRINLTTYVNGSPIRLNLSRTFIEKLTLNQTEYINLTITSFGQPGKFKALIRTSVASPRISKLFELKTEIVERELSNKTYTKARLGFANNLLLENPICAEFSELLQKAEIALNDTEYEEARSLTELFITRCKELVKPVKELVKPVKELELPKKAPSKILRTLLYVLLSAASLTLLVIIFVWVLKRVKRKPPVKPMRPEEDIENLFREKINV
jgi:hypothetical protein